jgi:hypothetical protein
MEPRVEAVAVAADVDLIVVELGGSLSSMEILNSELPNLLIELGIK